MNKTTININIYNKRLYFIVYKIKEKISKIKLKNSDFVSHPQVLKKRIV